MLIAVLVAIVFISGGIAVHQYLREHPPLYAGERLTRLYNADHPKAKARAVRNAKALKAGTVEQDGAVVALGRILWFFAWRAYRGIRRTAVGVVEQGKARAAADNAKADNPPAAEPTTTDETDPAGADAPAGPATVTEDDPASATAPTEEVPTVTAATMNGLYEASEAIGGQKFDGIIAVERFARAVAAGTESITATWTRWAERLAGPLHVDDSVVDHIRACAQHQATIAGLTGEAATGLTSMINGSIEDGLERGQTIPHHSLMDSGGGYPAVPAFYERFGTYTTRRHEDIRGELLLMAAVIEASRQQAAMFRATARHMEDQRNVNYRAAAEKYYSAANVQDAITAQVEAAHAQFGIIIRMSIRALTESTMKAPNANMVGVG